MAVHQYSSSDRCNYTRHNEVAREIDTHTPAFSNRTSGVFTGLAVTTGGGGLSLRIAAGKALINRTLRSPSLATLSATNTAFSFVYVSGVGTVSKATMSTLPSTFAVLAVAQASGGVVTRIRDLRVRIGEYILLSPGGATAWRLSILTGGVLSVDSL